MERSVEDLSKYRLDCSHEALEDAKIMYEAKRYKNALNRAYYAIFHGVRAVNALDGFDSSKHSGVIAYFNQNYVKTGIFPKEASKIIRMASEKRESADYLDFFVASQDEADAQIKRAEIFMEWIEEYLKTVWH
ncbi:MAG: HEPN domain-containing protein [Blautia sp.]|nr:HEPN domain-containing protein [Lachnoclostridium sp.]MCM1212221.1 HEPN domain-containing protein [Blautia sp.]